MICSNKTLRWHIYIQCTSTAIRVLERSYIKVTSDILGLTSKMCESNLFSDAWEVAHAFQGIARHYMALLFHSCGWLKMWNQRHIMNYDSWFAFQFQILARFGRNPVTGCHGEFGSCTPLSFLGEGLPYMKIANTNMNVLAGGFSNHLNNLKSQFLKIIPVIGWPI